MPILHMQTEQVRESGRQLTQTATNIDEQADRVQSGISALEAGWEGGSSDSFISQASGVINELRRLAQSCCDLGSRVVTEVDEWEMVDSNGAQSIHLGDSLPSLATGAATGLGVGIGTGVVFDAEHEPFDIDNFHLFRGSMGQGYAGVRSGEMTDQEAIDYALEDPFRRDIWDYLDVDAKVAGVESAAGVALLSGALPGGYFAVGSGQLAGAAGLELSEEGLVGQVSGRAGIYAIEASASGEVAGVELAGQTYVGANVEGEVKAAFQPIAGDMTVGAKIDAFAGATADGSVSKEVDFGAVDVEAGVRGSARAGIGFIFEGDVGFDDGIFAVDLDVGAVVGIGGSIGFNFEVDAREAASLAVDWVDDLF